MKVKNKAVKTKDIETTDLGIPRSLPDDIIDAIEAYANYYWTMDQGYGSAVDAAANSWIKARNDLLAWDKKRKKALLP